MTDYTKDYTWIVIKGKGYLIKKNNNPDWVRLLLQTAGWDPAGESIQELNKNGIHVKVDTSERNTKWAYPIIKITFA